VKVSQGNVATCLRCDDIFNHPLLQIYCWVRHWNNFEYRSTFSEVIGKSTMSCFSTQRVWRILTPE